MRLEAAANRTRAVIVHALRLSLATRLVLLYAMGTILLLAALGIGLSMLLRVHLDARDIADLNGKTEIVTQLLREPPGPSPADERSSRFAQIVIGHPTLQVGLREGLRWLVEPAEPVRALIDPAGNDAIPHVPHYSAFRRGDQTWWLRRIDYVTDHNRTLSAYVAIDVTHSQHVRDGFMRAMVGAGVLGVVASSLIGWFAARRGLAPLASVAREAESVTADRLGEPMPAHDAPDEVRSLIAAINRMLERLQASFKALEDFSADIAHELRTPINNLMLQTQVTLSRRREATEYEEALHSNLAQLERLQRMVSDMLFLARVDRGMLKLERETVDLAHETVEVADFFDAAVAERAQRIEVSGSATAACDRGMARRAITNLVSNAVRYSPPGATVRITLANDPGGGALVQVENPAPPMATDELQRLFARFARRPQAADKDSGGIGLGLSIVESIMRLHGGTVRANSSGIGIRFTLSFPPPSDRESM